MKNENKFTFQKHLKKIIFNLRVSHYQSSKFIVFSIVTSFL